MNETQQAETSPPLEAGADPAVEEATRQLAQKYRRDPIKAGGEREVNSGTVVGMHPEKHSIFFCGGAGGSEDLLTVPRAC